MRGVFEKPRVKCSECLHQHWLPVTDDVIRWHLSGIDDHRQPFVMGVYPMLLDERRWFLAADFDGKDWAVDAKAFLETCHRLDVPAALERSSSGNGGHVWIFFDEAVPAALERKLGAHVLTEAMESRPELGFRSHDRFFPNQDTLAKGGFGNLSPAKLFIHGIDKRFFIHGNGKKCRHFFLLIADYVNHIIPTVQNIGNLAN